MSATQPCLWPSELAAQYARLSPLGNPAVGNTSCALCGRPIAKGEPCTVETIKGIHSSFTDRPNMAYPGAPCVCGWCSRFLSKTVMMKLSAAVFTKEGVFPLLKDVHRAWFLLTPPEPPFIAIVATQKLQHLIWRAPVSLSKDYFTVQYGDRSLPIRHKVLCEALQVCSTAAKLHRGIKYAGKKNVLVKFRPHPFVSLDRKASSLSHGLLRPDFLRMAREHPQLRTCLHSLRELQPGELWALATLAKTNTPTPEQPEPIVFPS